MIPLAVLEQVIDTSGAAPQIEAMLLVGVRARQLSVRTLLVGMCLAQADHRPAHLTRVHQALVSLPGDTRSQVTRDCYSTRVIRHYYTAAPKRAAAR